MSIKDSVITLIKDGLQVIDIVSDLQLASVMYIYSRKDIVDD